MERECGFNSRRVQNILKLYVIKIQNFIINYFIFSEHVGGSYLYTSGVLVDLDANSIVTH